MTARFRPIVLLAVLSVLAGVLVAGAAFPVVAGLGLVARSGAESFETLPAELREPPLPLRTRVVTADGAQLAALYFNEDRVAVRLADVPPIVRNAVLAVEDERFYEHNGVDMRGLFRAMVRNRQAGEVTEGGSTITQQYVKNVLVQAARTEEEREAATERSVARKMREARLAIAVERRYSKDQILEKYLNIAYFGDDVYGVGTAAQHWFGKPLKRVGLAEAALLAGLVKSPTQYDPARNPKAAKARRDVVIDRMVAAGFVTPAQAAKAKREPVRVRRVRTASIEDNPVAPYFLDLLRREVIEGDDPDLVRIFGKTRDERTQALFQGGFTIRTTLDRRLQDVARATLRETLPLPGDPGAATVVVEPGTGAIRVMAGINHERDSKKVNLATGGRYGFQPGSTFKPFVLAAAIEQGIPLSLTLHSPARYRSKEYVNYVDGRIEPYTVGNAGDSTAGTFDLVRASWNSVNTYYLQLQERTGYQRPAQIARAMGIRSFPLREVPSFVLGSNEVSPLDMAAAYAAFANRGSYCRPILVTEVIAPDGTSLGGQRPTCEQAIEPEVADVVTSILRGVVDRGTGKAARIGRPTAGKTGTTNGPTAAWFAGYTPDLAGVVWMGHPTDPAKRPLKNIHGVRNVYGGTFPARIWQRVMSAAHERYPVRDFELPPARATVLPRPPAPKPPIPGLPPGVMPPDTGRGKDDEKKTEDKD